MKQLRSCLSLPVATVLLVTGFVYYTVVFLVIDPWLSLGTSTGLLNAIAFTCTTLMALCSYALAVLRDPGEIPSSFVPDLEDCQLQEVKRKGVGEQRYCQKCRVYKPARAHHCRICGRCVLRMDHHCLWINNCIGHNNYKTFFLFVLYVAVASLHSLVLFGCQAIQDFGEMFQMDYRENHAETGALPSSKLVKGFCGLLLLPISATMCVLLGWHVYLISQNKTTIEYYEGIRPKWQAEKSGIAYRHPYDLGVVTNVLSVFGPRATCWCCPMAVGHIGSGLNYKTYYDEDS